MKKLPLFLSALFLPFLAQGSVSTNKTLMLETNNTLPPNETNFFAANSNLLNASVSPAGYAPTNLMTNAVANIPGETIVGSYLGPNYCYFGYSATTGLLTNASANVGIVYQNGPYPITGLRAWCGNVNYTNFSGAYTTLNPFGYTNQWAWQYPLGGTIYPATYNGATNIVIQPNQLPVPTDPATFVVPANAFFMLRGSRQASNVWPGGFTLNANGQRNGELWDYNTSNKCFSGTISNASGNNVTAYGPDLITGLRADGCRNQSPSILVEADSIFFGEGSIEGFGYQDTILNRVLTNCNYANFAFPGTTLEQEATNVFATNLTPAFGQIVLHETKINSFKSAVGDSFATVTNLIISNWNALHALGKTVIETTCTPAATSSSDGYTSYAGQTLDANTPQMLLFNSWLRTNQYGVPVLDLAACCSSNGYWLIVPGGALTSDGTHFNDYGSYFIATNGFDTQMETVLQLSPSSLAPVLSTNLAINTTMPATFSNLTANGEFIGSQPNGWFWYNTNNWVYWTNFYATNLNSSKATLLSLPAVGTNSAMMNLSLIAYCPTNASVAWFASNICANFNASGLLHAFSPGAFGGNDTAASASAVSGANDGFYFESTDNTNYWKISAVITGQVNP